MILHTPLTHSGGGGWVGARLLERFERTFALYGGVSGGRWETQHQCYKYTESMFCFDTYEIWTILSRARAHMPSPCSPFPLGGERVLVLCNCAANDTTSVAAFCIYSKVHRSACRDGGVLWRRKKTYFDGWVWVVVFQREVKFRASRTPTDIESISCAVCVWMLFNGVGFPQLAWLYKSTFLRDC